LANGANPNFRYNKDQVTPLHCCLATANRIAYFESGLQCLELLFNAGASPRLVMQVHLEIKILYERHTTKFPINVDTMQTILLQDNEFSRHALVLDKGDKEETLEQRFLRIWTSMSVESIRISVAMNALEYTQHRKINNKEGNIPAIALFNNWRHFYCSPVVKALLSILCLSPLWVHCGRDIIGVLISYFSNNSRQIIFFQQWVAAGRQLPKSQAISKSTLPESAQNYSRFFSQAKYADEAIVPLQSEQMQAGSSASQVAIGKWLGK